MFENLYSAKGFTKYKKLYFSSDSAVENNLHEILKLLQDGHSVSEEVIKKTTAKEISRILDISSVIHLSQEIMKLVILAGEVNGLQKVKMLESLVDYPKLFGQVLLESLSSSEVGNKSKAETQHCLIEAMRIALEGPLEDGLFENLGPDISL